MTLNSRVHMGRLPSASNEALAHILQFLALLVNYRSTCGTKGLLGVFNVVLASPNVVHVGSEAADLTAKHTVECSSCLEQASLRCLSSLNRRANSLRQLTESLIVRSKGKTAISHVISRRNVALSSGEHLGLVPR